VSGREAANMGLANTCVPDAELDGHARGLATSISRGPTAAFAASKRLIRQIRDDGLPLVAVLDAEAAAQSDACRTRDYQAGIRAFLNKTSVTFTGG
jgi:enoyl-CoA hydratase/carnithine racemase